VKLLEKAGRVALAFVMMKYAAVAGLLVAMRGRKVWR
jgi:hypothetical protein